MTTQQTIWNYLISKGFTKESAAGVMGNIDKESKFNSSAVQSNKIYDNATYTRLVDNGIYQNFVSDKLGYGIVQWTYEIFKQDLLNRCKSLNKSISDLNCQLEQLYSHLQSENILNQLKNLNSVNQATLLFMLKFEKPEDQSEEAQKERIELANKWYNTFAFTSVLKDDNKMKYNRNNPPLICMMTDSTCYKSTNQMAIKGVLWHSTGANNKTLKRYVQPSLNDSNYNNLINMIGKNTNGNDWNTISIQAGLNAWIGTLADGSIAAVQTMPWDFKPWGCGSGSKGSCNNGWIQFEICEDNLIDGNYFIKAYQEACELTAYLCKIYNINPLGTVQFNGITVPTILCHQDSYQLGLGTNHSDVYHWFNRYGKNMDNVRNDVAKLLGQNTSITTPIHQQQISNFPLLKKGSDNEEAIKQLQESLIKLGYNLGSWGADGDFGTATYNAVKIFQQKNNLEVDGVVGEETWTAIQKALQTIVSANEVYRVRKSWLDIKSQIGAYKDLNNAKMIADKLGPNYHVYNSQGAEVYPTVSSAMTETQESNSSIAIDLPIAKTYDDVMLASASKDENGRYTGGRKGDQTGKEVYILNWYKQNWNYVLRPKTQSLAENIARAAEAGCTNDNIGYSQGARNTLYIEAQKVGLDLSKITTPCDCDCSSFVSICCICAGLSPSIFYQGGNMRTTYTMKEACEQTGQFYILTGSNYTSQKNYLKRGDILLNSNQHVTIVLQDGQNAEQTAIPTVNLSNGYRVRVLASVLNIRAGASSSAAIKGQIFKDQVYTIIEEKEGFGKLKSGVGWIDLQYTIKL